MPDYPNPFNPNPMIRYAPPEKSNVALAVFNTPGVQVATPGEGALRAGDFIKTKKLAVEK
jgi:hypothetical protein